VGEGRHSDGEESEDIETQEAERQPQKIQHEWPGDREWDAGDEIKIRPLRMNWAGGRAGSDPPAEQHSSAQGLRPQPPLSPLPMLLSQEGR
jgi:hypothetical protein